MIQQPSPLLLVPLNFYARPITTSQLVRHLLYLLDVIPRGLWLGDNNERNMDGTDRGSDQALTYATKIRDK